MGTSTSNGTWRDRLVGFSDNSSAIVDPAFLDRFGDWTWSPSDADKFAAHAFHVELISRVATQPLGYSSGVEQRALSSVFELFGIARALTQREPDCQTFEVVVWHVLNTYVRPFTAKWHARSAAGELSALDNSDVFRAELQALQMRLISLDRILDLIRDRRGFPASIASREFAQTIQGEMARGVTWRPMGETQQPGRSELSMEEEHRVKDRRQHYEIGSREWAAGLALSGGGIRSATFAMGVMVALSKRGLLQQFDYLSTVSGGGYAGSLITQLLGANDSKSNLGLRRTELPFKRNEGESEILQRFRQGANYLSALAWERFTLGIAQAQGIFINLFIVLSFISMIAFVDYLFRFLIPDSAWNKLALYSSIALSALFLGIPLIRGWRGRALASEARWMASVGAALLVPPVWVALGTVHSLFEALLTIFGSDRQPAIAQLIVAWTVFASLLVVVAAAFTRIALSRPIILFAFSVIALTLAEAIAYHQFQIAGTILAACFVFFIVALGITLCAALDVNSTSLHNYYRAKLAQAFLFNADCREVPPIKLSAIAHTPTLFPILNCALNVPGSTNSRTRGRNADVMSFTPVSAGAALIGHSATADWEQANPSLDLATAMALSGAAISPQMGLKTSRYSSFWLTVLNLRLGAWLKNPKATNQTGLRPNGRYLLQELLATADETKPYLQISDGGHIENLGVYELLRRRCRFIVAVDGEHDEMMTFHGLTNLQRLAYIDFGITIEANLDDLRLGSEGLSRSHFRFCRIRYPLEQHDRQEEIGYLIYLKLSLTGNEGEFIRRLKFDEPSFPHHTTANQFFTEVQFEAYRALGEHVGDKMFLPSLTAVSDDSYIDIEVWFSGLGSSFLDL
ncbi:MULTISPECIES: patatin-like phospholipase domain-containing protein [Bradyrhizobium]|uniref:patatin-like phospholipase family protein n=1 Tax=Bradyrhizobium TaxID=374 RepID=UPI0004B9C1AC|nr:patatin-like phospholipase family protein [Bradyrhizobium sp. CCBAU 15544]